MSEYTNCSYAKCTYVSPISKTLMNIAWSATFMRLDTIPNIIMGITIFWKENVVNKRFLLRNPEWFRWHLTTIWQSVTITTTDITICFDFKIKCMCDRENDVIYRTVYILYMVCMYNKQVNQAYRDRFEMWYEKATKQTWLNKYVIFYYFTHTVPSFLKHAQ